MKFTLRSPTRKPIANVGRMVAVAAVAVHNRARKARHPADIDALLGDVDNLRAALVNVRTALAATAEVAL